MHETCKSEMYETCKSDIRKNNIHSNIHSNRHNNDALSASASEAQNTDDNFELFRANVIAYLNSKAGVRFSSRSESTAKYIRARYNEGYTLDDFRLVIDAKVAAWSEDAKMRKYLRPQTLFADKFDSYLNEAEADRKSQAEAAEREAEWEADWRDEFEAMRERLRLVDNEEGEEA